jgi:hypothetical protein
MLVEDKVHEPVTGLLDVAVVSLDEGVFGDGTSFTECLFEGGSQDFGGVGTVGNWKQEKKSHHSRKSSSRWQIHQLHVPLIRSHDC